MTTAHLDHLLALCASATPGPWEADVHEPDDVVVWAKTPEGDPRGEDGLLVTNVGHSRIGSIGVAFDSHAADAELIAALRNAAPALIAAARAAEALAPVCVELGSYDFNAHEGRARHFAACEDCQRITALDAALAELAKVST